MLHCSILVMNESKKTAKPGTSTKVSPAPISPAKYSLTIEQVIDQFSDHYFIGEKAGFRAKSNYPRLIRRYLEFCQEANLPILGGLTAYRQQAPIHYCSPVRTFLFYYQQAGCPTLTAKPKPIEPNQKDEELIKRFIYQAGHLRGNESKRSYQKGLMAFFRWIAQQREKDNKQSTAHKNSGSGSGGAKRGRPTKGRSLTLGPRFDRVGVQQFIEHLREQTYSPFTINLYLAALKSLAEWVIGNPEHYPLDAAQLKGVQQINTIETLPVENKFYKDALSREERQRLMDHCTTPLLRSMISLMAYSGLRTVELTRLRYCDIKLDQAVVEVMGKGRYTLAGVKLMKPSIDSLRAYIQEHPPKKPDDLLFPGFDTRKIRSYTDAVLYQAGLKRKGISPHSLRHTSAQLLLDAGVEAIYVQLHLRHSRFDTTEIYVRKKTMELYFDKILDSE